jgi:uncharacterized protein (UPF0371 family)
MGREAVYRSPTDMGVNRAGFGIVDDEAVRAAARQEVIRRYFRYACEYAMGFADKETVNRAEVIMCELNLKPTDRPVVPPARQAADEARVKGKGNEGIFCGAAIALEDGAIVTGKNSPIMHADASLVLNAVKRLAEIPDRLHLLPPNIMESISHLKKDILSSRQISLDLEETLIALAISAASNPAAELALEKLKELRNCEVHITHIPTPGDEAGLRRLGLNPTSDPNFASKCLFVA